MTTDHHTTLAVLTPNVFPYIVVDGKGDMVATVTFIYSNIPGDPRGEQGSRCRCFLQVQGAPMVLGHVDGGGMDLREVAFPKAASQLKLREDAHADEDTTAFQQFKALGDSKEYSWQADVRRLGYKVHCPF